MTPRPTEKASPDLLAGFEALGDPEDPRALFPVLNDVVEAAAGECLEAMLEATQALAAALPAAGHGCPASALHLPGGGCVHAVATGSSAAVGLTFTDAGHHHAVVLDTERVVEGADGVPVGMGIVSVARDGGDAVGAMDRLVADLADDRVMGVEVQVADSKWDLATGEFTWEPGLRWLDRDTRWVEVAGHLAEAIEATGLGDGLRLSRHRASRRTYVTGHPAEALGIDVARDAGLVVGPALLGTLSAMAARAAEPMLEGALPDLVAAHAACLPHGGGGVVLPTSCDGVDHVAASSDGAGGGTLRVRARGEAVEATFGVDAAGAVTGLSVRAGLDPGPDCREGDVAMSDVAAFAVEAGALRAVVPPSPTGRAMAFLETLATAVPALRERLATGPSTGPGHAVH